ncbi:nitrate- and nitrite sensing domain-containing protein [Nonomuraea fastidiosa]|uniref:sensor histidine kinase n=1 Tax=Nonomuraea fastidiosa TaxID=46173 RepID=UPI00366EA6AE
MRTRLIALIAIPTIVGVIFGGLRVTDSISSAQQYQLISDVGRLVSQLGELARDLGLERGLAGRYVAANKRASEGQRLKSQQEIVDASAARTKAAIAEARDSVSDIGRRTLDRIEVRLSQLGSLRAAYTKDQMPPLPTVEKYSEIIADLLQVYDELGQGSTDEQLTSTAAALRSVARAEEEASKQRALLMIALVRGRFEEPEFKGFLDAGSRRESERSSFLAVATPAQRQNFDNTVASQKIGRAEFYISRAVLLHNSGTPLRRLDNSSTKDVDLWFDSISETVDRLHQVQKSLSEEVATRSADVASADRQLAAINIGIVVVLLVLVLAITALMAGSLVRPLRRLRSDALRIAGHTLPDLVRQLRENDIDPDKIRVPPIEINSKDEIGEVARAFDEVHREAVRLAGEESRLRSNVNAMFVNLSRRSQTLVERQITLIDSLEQGEQDEQRLGNLFKLDHLATRMRRNSENLLVLAGQEPPRRWSQPVQLVDVARASLSEVENYERVVLEVPEGVSIAGQAVNDVIHLLAELIENALSFSPRETRVPVSGSRIDGGGIMLSISDSGIGMTAEELAQANERLSEAPTVDVSVSRRMGLFVVARLAHRHGIRVQLRPHGSGGLTAMVLIPESLLGPSAPSYAGAAPAASREEQFPSVPQPGPQGGSWPAASYQLGPGHPSYPSYPSAEAFPSAGSWPSSPALPAEAAGWMSQDSSNDVWVASRGAPAGESRSRSGRTGCPGARARCPSAAPAPCPTTPVRGRASPRPAATSPTASPRPPAPCPPSRPVSPVSQASPATATASTCRSSPRWSRRGSTTPRRPTTPSGARRRRTRAGARPRWYASRCATARPRPACPSGCPRRTWCPAPPRPPRRPRASPRCRRSRRNGCAAGCPASSRASEPHATTSARAGRTGPGPGITAVGMRAHERA